MENKTHCYRHEMKDDCHTKLADYLHGVKGMVILSGYPCDLYDQDLYKDWLRIERKAFADGAKERIEVIWMNEACAKALAEQEIQQRMFA
ncbi:MAG TPA: hypothetical protein VES38_06725 [Methylotenera sp.]|nr:hypothetical protein [Methylotenera sp.]